jgi:hypothetical protein
VWEAEDIDDVREKDCECDRVMESVESDRECEIDKVWLIVFVRVTLLESVEEREFVKEEE